MIYQIAGYLSGIAMLLSFGPYIKDIFLHLTKPQKVSWLIWAILGFISFASQFSKGASYSLIMTGAQAIGDFSIFVLVIKYGFGGWQKRDIISLFGVGVSLFLWYLTSEPAVALFLVIFTDAIGVVLTMVKSYQNPATETVSTWVLTFMAGWLGCLAVGSFNFILLAFPLYIALASLAILAAIKLGFMAKSQGR